MILYQPMVDSLVYQLAKTTLLTERKSCAWEALFEAVLSYTASQGDIEVYLAKRVRAALIRHNESLLPKEKTLYKMICSGFRLPQIAEELGIEEENVQVMGQDIGRKRTAFYRTT